MAEFLTGDFPIPDEIQEMLKGAPEPLKNLLENAIKKGKGVKIIDMTSIGKEKEKEKPKAPEDLLRKILGLPTALELLKTTVTLCLEEHDKGCSACIKYSTKPMGVPLARCLKDMNTFEEVLLKGVLLLAKDSSVMQRIRLLAKIFNTTAEELPNVFEEAAKFLKCGKEGE